MPITTLTAGLMGLLLLILSARVIQARGQVSKQSASEEILQRRIRGQGNLIEYAPTVLILLGLLEFQNVYGPFLWAAAGLFVAGRLLHGYAFGFTDYSAIGRTGGAALTLISLGLLSFAAMTTFLAG